MPEIDSQKYQMGYSSRPSLSDRVKASLSPEHEPERVQVADIWPVKMTDVSAWQGVIDFTLMCQQAQVIYIRAGYGNEGFDGTAATNAAGAKNVGMPWGLYWYVKAGKDFKKHVASFKSVWQDFGGVMPPVWDCEYTDYLVNVKNNTGNWLTKLIKNWQDATGIDPIIYTRANWWNSNTYRMDWPKTLLLWTAHYNSGITEPLIPDDWGKVANPRTWTFWQWSADGNGKGALHGVESYSIDLDRYNGSIAQFNNRFKTDIKPLGEVTPPPPPPSTDPIKPLYRVKFSGTALNVRGGPGAEYTDLGEITTNAVVPIVEESGDWVRIDGWIHKNYVKKI